MVQGKKNKPAFTPWPSLARMADALTNSVIRETAALSLAHMLVMGFLLKLWLYAFLFGPGRGALVWELLLISYQVNGAAEPGPYTVRILRK